MPNTSPLKARTTVCCGPVVQRRLPLPSIAYTRLCEQIEPEPADGSIIVTGVQQRFETLTLELPLGGGEAMKPGTDGALALTEFLYDEAPWLGAAIDRIDAQLRLQLWTGRPWVAFRPIVLVGPPGCGKSHLARLIASQAGTGFATLDLAGTSDNRTLEGTARGWTTAQPCFPAITINRTATANPVICLEEIDKAGGSSRNGDPLATILTMIEPSTSRGYFDKCLLAPLDLSHVNWIMTANDANRLPGPLRSRLDVIELGGPGPEHFEKVFANLLRDLANRWDLKLDMIPSIDRGIEAMLKDRFAGHHSVRRLMRELETVLAALIRTTPRPVH